MLGDHRQGLCVEDFGDVVEVDSVTARVLALRDELDGNQRIDTGLLRRYIHFLARCKTEVTSVITYFPNESQSDLQRNSATCT